MEILFSLFATNNKDGLFVHWKQALVVWFSFITKKQSFLLDFLLYYKNN